MSEQSRIEFEKSMQDKFGWNNTEHILQNPNKYSNMVYQHIYYAWAGWQAATAEANKRIAELEGEVAELKEEFAKTSNHLVRRFGNEKEKNNQLKASNHDLRKILLEIRDRFFPANQPESDKDLMWDDVNTAVDATPVESLQAHDYSDTERLNFLDGLQERATSDMKINMSLQSDIHINGSLGVSLYIRNYKGHTESTAYGKTIREAIDMALKEVK